MSSQLIVAGLDLGSHCVKCVIGLLHSDGQLDVIGTGSHPALGFKQGVVCDQERAVQTIRAAVDEAELMAGCEIKEVYLSVSSRHLASFNGHGMARIMSETVEVSDIHAAIDLAKAVKLQPDVKILHVIPQDYIVDGRGGIEHPLGVCGIRLEVQAHMVTGEISQLEALEYCCQKAKLTVVDVLYGPLAQSELLLTDDARQSGVILIDIGADTTDVAVFEGGGLVHAATFCIGGEHVTRDIEGCLNTPAVEAEHLKRSHGAAQSDQVSPEDTISIPGVGARKSRVIKRTFLCEIIEARLEELFTLIVNDLDEWGYLANFPGGVVITGGTAAMAGISELAEQVLGIPTGCGEPKGVHGLVDVVRSPRYATAAGLVLSGVKMKHLQWFSTRQIRLKKRPTHGMFRRLWGRA